jgi:hypothetical protein
MESTLEIGKKLVALCKQSHWLEAVDTLYSPDIVSIEAVEMAPGRKRMEGIAAVREKTVRFLKDVDIHSCAVTGPWPHGIALSSASHWTTRQKMAQWRGNALLLRRPPCTP